MWTKELTKKEFDCKHTGINRMKPEFMAKLQELRLRYGKPMKIVSGYRDATHPEERKKPVPGQHFNGVAVDVGCFSDEAYIIVKLAFELGFTGIGISQKNGLPRFIHLDMRTTTPVIYSY